MKKIFIIITLVVMITVTGCSNTVKTTSPTITVEDLEGRKVVVRKNIDRIVVLNASSLNILYGLGGKAVGRTQTNIPLTSEMERVEVVGAASKPSMEKIAALNPDLILGNIADEKLIQAAESLNVPIVFTRMESYADTLKAIELIGTLINAEEKAKAEIDRIERQKNELVAKVPNKGPRVIILMGQYKELKVALPHSFTGDLVSILNGESIAQYTDKSDKGIHYMPLSMEKLVQYNPDIILTLSHGKPNVMEKRLKEEIQNNTAWQEINAVKNNRIVHLPYDLFVVKPGIRIIESLNYLSNILYSEGL